VWLEKMVWWDDIGRGMVKCIDTKNTLFFPFNIPVGEEGRKKMGMMDLFIEIYKDFGKAKGHWQISLGLEALKTSKLLWP